MVAFLIGNLSSLNYQEASGDWEPKTCGNGSYSSALLKLNRDSSVKSVASDETIVCFGSIGRLGMNIADILQD